MTRHLYAVVGLGLVSVVVPSRAVARLHAESDHRNTVMWNNDDLERLRDLGLISIVGRVNDETNESPSLPHAYLKTQDPAWYSTQAAKLRDELERRQDQLHGYQQALEDARSLRNTTGGIDFVEGNIGITPEAGIEILWQRVDETQTELDALDDLARRHDIPPSTVRGR